jgi:hypothetical protein
VSSAPHGRVKSPLFAILLAPGHITTHEALEREGVHALILRTRTRALRELLDDNPRTDTLDALLPKPPEDDFPF